MYLFKAKGPMWLEESPQIRISEDGDITNVHRCVTFPPRNGCNHAKLCLDVTENTVVTLTDFVTHGFSCLMILYSTKHQGIDSCSSKKETSNNCQHMFPCNITGANKMQMPEDYLTLERQGDVNFKVVNTTKYTSHFYFHFLGTCFNVSSKSPRSTISQGQLRWVPSRTRGQTERLSCV